MKKRVLNILLISVIILISVGSSSNIIFATTYDEFSGLIESAEANIIEVFIILSEAENAGADITTIMEKLRSVTYYLSEAKINLYKNPGEVDIPELRAKIESITEIYKEAVQVKNTAVAIERSAQQDLLFSITLRIAGFIIIVYGIEYFYNSYQNRKRLKYKPEVAGHV